MSCAFCNSENFEILVDFGPMALAGGFLKEESIKEEKLFQMTLIFCNQCFMVQILEKIDPDEMFSDYFYFSSAIGTLSEHFSNYAKDIKNKFNLDEHSSVLEFGCNDGVLLKPLSELKLGKVIGVDPASNVIKTINEDNLILYANYFNEDTADIIIAEHGTMDVVMANNVYAHIVDIQSTTRGIKKILSNSGVFVFEVHYVGNVIKDKQYDMIYHEHIYYYSLLSAIEHFKRYEMKIFDIKHVPIHGGSLRFYVSHAECNQYEKSLDVTNLERQEISLGYRDKDTYQTFSQSIYKLKEDLRKLLIQLKSSGKKIYGYGASGRANTVLQFCDIDKELIDGVIDDAPAKQGFVTPGSHLRICSSDILRSDDKPDFILLFAWTFEEEIRRRNPDFFQQGGKIILPLPEVKVIG